MLRQLANKRLFAAAMLFCALPLSARAQSPSVSLVSPAQGSTMASRTIVFRAVANGFTPTSMDFYLGDPSDSLVDLYLGGPDQVEGTEYVKTVTLQADGAYQAYAWANNRGTFLQSPLVTFTINTQNAPPRLTLNYPPPGGVVTATEVPFCVETSGFNPVRVDVYQGEPNDAFVDIYMGQAERVGEGRYALDYTLPPGSNYPVYAVATDGATTLQTPVSTFTIDTRPGAVASPRRGDLNGDSLINILDATLSLQLTVGLRQPTEPQQVTGDVNNDRQLGILDTTMILQMAVGLRPTCV